MRIVKNEIKLSAMDIKFIETFIWHAERDMEYGSEGTYGRYNIINSTLDKSSLNRGKRGMQLLRKIVTYIIDNKHYV